MTKDGIFYPHLSTHLSVPAQRKEIREIFKLTRHPLLTEKMAELLYRTLHSGFWMGPNKCNKKRGDIHTCMVCGQVENVLHTFCECYKITHFLTALLKWWEHRTSEQLSVSPRTMLLGLRDEDPTQFKDLTLPFTYLRGHAISTIKNERLRLQKGLEPRSVPQLVKDTLIEMQSSVNMLFEAAKEWDKWSPPKEKEVHLRSVRSFKEAWVDTGLAMFTRTKSLPVILRARGH